METRGASPEFEKAVIEKKGRLLYGEKEAFTEEELQEAESHVHKMRENLGSLEAVSINIDLEMYAKELGLEKDFFDMIRDLQKALLEDLTALLSEGLQRWKANPQFNIFEFVVQRALQNNDAQYARLTLDSPALSQFSREHPDEFLQLTMIWHELQERIQCRVVLDHVDEMEAVTAGGSQGGKPPERKKYTPEQQEERMRRAVQLVSGSNEKPPPGGGPEDYEKVEPDNLEDVKWPNGDVIRFQTDRILKDDKGRERRFYTARYEYTPEGKSEKVTVDLSEYLPSKHVIFEGTKGAITGASLDPSVGYNGWASSPPREGNYLVALNMEHLRQGPHAMLTVFHELGHVYLFGGEEKKILGETEPRPRKEQSFMDYFRKLVGKEAPKEDSSARPRGIEMYQEDVHRMRERIHEDLFRQRQFLSEIQAEMHTPSKPAKAVAIAGKPMIILGKNPETAKLFDRLRGESEYSRRIWSLMSAHDLSTRQFNYLLDSAPEFKRLRSVFHERMADAFALRQVRQLNNDLQLSSQETRGQLRRSRKVYEQMFREPRYTKGIRGGRKRGS